MDTLTHLLHIQDSYGKSTSRHTLDVCSGREEPPFPSEDGEDCIGMFVQFPDRRDGLDHEFAAERVERFGSIELDDADLADDLEDDVLVLVGRHGFLGLGWL